MDDILVDRKDHIVTLTFNRPQKRNAFTHAMYDRMADVLEESAKDPDVHVLILRGQEDCFTGGNDLFDFLNNPPRDEKAPVFRFLNAVSTFPKMLVSAVAGHATGVGVTMLLHCDINIAADNALFSTPFVNLAVVPEAASSLLMPLVMGHHRAARFFLLADVIGAQDALDYGLILEVTTPDQLFARADELAHTLAAKPPLALQLAKKLMKGELAPDIAKRMEDEAVLFRQQMFSKEAKTAFANFLQKSSKRG